jgi:hypothetical protein
VSARSAVAATATVGVLVGVLGSPALVDAAQELAERHHMPLTAATFTDIPNWDVFDSGTTAEVAWGVVLKLSVLFVTVGLLAALAGRASHGAAFLAGWGSLVVAAAMAGAVDFAYRDAVVEPARNPVGVSYFDSLLGATNTGAGYGLWTGWMVGAAVAVAASLPSRTAVPSGAAIRPIARPRTDHAARALVGGRRLAIVTVGVPRGLGVHGAASGSPAGGRRPGGRHEGGSRPQLHAGHAAGSGGRRRRRHAPDPHGARAVAQCGVSRPPVMNPAVANPTVVYPG